MRSADVKTHVSKLGPERDLAVQDRERGVDHEDTWPERRKGASQFVCAGCGCVTFKGFICYELVQVVLECEGCHTCYVAMDGEQ